ncbi:hypothetical protein BDV95DRAFT_547933 [Massariosphaeria phaeospora]|uniref:T6SS Phospholipase effector Tle1-like catalytic domain-containing protein n=1 Tax=Massariosphaeria phaeospora TaxID=100035 RepID=A0A7C8M7F7_9PLEO|nr:hypothetical protein BDV95DRAFT_547933 [Massariosphaeria phaeospora]
MADDKPWGRRLIVCCDGTWQSSVGSKENVPSNVTKLCRVIARMGNDKNDPAKKWHQIIYYDGGVGTGNITGFEAKRQGGTGAGLAENVIEAYNFIVMNYEPGDEICCFGFSRGAYTARAVAGLVTDIGVIKPIDMQLFPQVYRAYMSNREGKPFRETQAWKDFIDGKLSKKGHEMKQQGLEWGEKEEALGWDIRPHPDVAIDEDSRRVKVVGVWDTVGSLGVPDFAVFDNAEHRVQHGFHNVKLNEYIEHAYHALALDERRKAFRPTLWYIPKDLPAQLAKRGKQPPELKQVWFPGVHINCGGGSDDTIQDMKGDLEHLSTATFTWMLQCISPHITIDSSAFLQYLTQYSHWRSKIRYACTYHHDGWLDWGKKQLPSIPYLNPANNGLTDPRRDPPHAHPAFDYGWGTGPVVQSYAGMYVLAGALERVPGHCQAEMWDPKAGEYVLDDINEYGATNEYIHPICAFRELVRGPEQGGVLRGFERRFEGGRYWWYHKSDEREHMRPLPEWVVLRHEGEGVGVGVGLNLNFERVWYGRCERTGRVEEAMQREGVEDWLADLDKRVDFGVGEKEGWVYP